MRKIVTLITVLSLSLAGIAAADGADSLNAGGWEFGGSLFYTFMPNYPVFAGGLTEDDTGDYFQFLDIGFNAGAFLADGFSLSLSPSLWYMGNHRVNATGQVSTEPIMTLELGVEPRWYLPVGPNMTLALAGNLGIGALPGIKYISSDVEYEDKSLDIMFSLEPKLAFYWHMGDMLAPFAELGWKLLYLWEIKNQDGSDVAYLPDYSFIDNVYARVHFTVGLKVFLPAGVRFADRRDKTFLEYMDIGAK